MISGYTIAGLVLAALCGLLSLLHLGLWRAGEDRVQAWMAAACFGFFLLNLSCAGGSWAALGGLGSPTLWIVPGLVALPLLLLGPERATAAMVRRPLDDRRWLPVAGPVIGLLRVADVARYERHLTAAGQPVTIEAVMNSFHTPTLFITLGFAFFSGAVASTEALEEVGRKSRVGMLMLFSAGVSLVLVVREILICAGVTPGPTLAGLCGLPFLAISSWVVAGRQVRVARAGRVKGQELGSYRLIRWLTQGGMGEVYLAARVGPAGFEREVALKRILAPGDAAAIERFLAEARLAASLRHPNIVAVHDLGRIDEAGKQGWFMAMEYLPGVTLSHLRNRLRDRGEAAPAELVTAVGAPVARALAYAHAQGVIHRDVSPQNVMLTFDGQVKVIDFGIAREEGGPRRTLSGQVVGKSPYMAPERIRGSPGGPAADVFSLGVLLWELAAGRRPFLGRTPVELGRNILSGQLPPFPPEIRVPRALEELIQESLRVDEAERATAEVLAVKLSALAELLPRLELGRVVRRVCADLWEEEQAFARLRGPGEVAPRRAPVGG